MQIRSACVYAQSSPTKNPLLRMLWCESVAPFGKPVVPLVYWMLIGSSKPSPARRSGSADRSAANSASHSGSPRKTTERSAGQLPRTCPTIAR